VASIGTLWLGRLLRGNDAGRTVLLRQIERSVVTQKEFETIRNGSGAYGKVRHPTFVKLLGVIEQDNMLVTVSEHLVGVPLLDLLRQSFDTGSPLPATVSVRIVLEAAKATVKAHRLSAEAGLFPTKRLFLPEGVFIATFGGTLLTEVGTLSTIANATAVKAIPDVISQLSPEEIATNNEHAQGSPEVFSLGVLLWETLANQWLFSQENEENSKNDLLNLPIPSLDTIERFGTHVPEQLVELVKTAIERNPQRRFDSVDRFITAIEQLPAHFIATEHQVAETLREHANLLVIRATVEDSALTVSGTFSEVPQSRVPTLPPAGSTFDAESPTFAQRQLISSINSPNPPASTTVSESRTQRLVPPASVILDEPSNIDGTISLANGYAKYTPPLSATTANEIESTSKINSSEAFSPFESTELIPGRKTPNRHRFFAKRNLLVSVIVLGSSLLIALTYVLLGRKATISPKDEGHIGPDISRDSSVASPLPKSKITNAFPTEISNTEALSRPTNEPPQTASNQPSPPDTKTTDSEAKNRRAPSTRSIPNTQPPTTTFRPRQITPYRPKGI
jgi:hypothetical protein